MISNNNQDWVNQDPYPYNATSDFIDRHLQTNTKNKIAIIDDNGKFSYEQLADRVNRTGNLLLGLGVRAETRIAQIQLDTINFPAVFWGAIKCGAVPVCINTLLTTDQYQHILNDSRAQVLVVSKTLLAQVTPILESLEYLEQVIVDGDDHPENVGRFPLGNLDKGITVADNTLAAAPTNSDEVAFWLYSSGSTGNPKGVPHIQKSIAATVELYAQSVLDMNEDDVVFSAAKLFFAYGLGNAMTFPLYLGATAVLMAERPTPDACQRIMKLHQPSIFFGVPTLYGAMLANPDITPTNTSAKFRRFISAGEALPEDIASAWQSRFGLPVLDGIGSTEMLHIFLSNYPDDYRYGTTGKPVPGYAARIVDEDSKPVATGEIGDLEISGPSAATGYWNQRGKTVRTFRGAWTVTGDKYFADADGYYHYCGRGDDMFKVSGNWVSPFEVESALISHPAVLEAAVVAHDDGSGLLKPRAFVVLNEGFDATSANFDTLKEHVKLHVSPWKYPRTIEYLNELPKTATGKIQRFKLRDS